MPRRIALHSGERGLSNAHNITRFLNRLARILLPNDVSIVAIVSFAHSERPFHEWLALVVSAPAFKVREAIL